MTSGGFDGDDRRRGLRHTGRLLPILLFVGQECELFRIACGFYLILILRYLIFICAFRSRYFR